MSEIHDENDEPMRPIDEEPAADEPAGQDEPPQTPDTHEPGEIEELPNS